ncbi:MAG: hypothetical protein EA376_10670 [Phycisphaeraceae bacterium]|nr:MAG: hypothetical protein EA376_10670 [Phycisphaeraceae bacterium]
MCAHSARQLRSLGFACAAFAVSVGIAAASPASSRGESGAIDLIFLNASGELQGEVLDQFGPGSVEDFQFWNVDGADTIASNLSMGVSSLSSTAQIQVDFTSGPISSQFLMTFSLGLDGSIDDYDPGQAERDAQVMGFIGLSTIFAEFMLASPHLLTVIIDPGDGEPLAQGDPFMVGAGKFAFSEVLPYSISLDLLGPDMSGQEQRTVSVMLDFVIPNPGAGALAFIVMAGMAGRRRRVA